MTCSLDIVIVNWNAGPNLEACLSSIEDATDESFVIENVIVIDNNSSDDSLYIVQEHAIPLRIINKKYNLGFAAACNLGAKNSTADYLLFLNPDTRLTSESLAVPLEFMESPESSGTAICGLKLLDDSGKMTTSCARFPTPGIFLGKTTGLSNILPGVFKEHLMSEAELNQSQYVDQVIGAFFLTRTRVFNELDGFDERFFMYFEEVDYSLRAMQKGYRSYVITDASAIHSGGVCANHAGANKLFYYLRSRLIYGLKHFRFSENLAMYFLTLTVEPVARLLLRISGRSASGIKEDFAAYGKLIAYLVFQSR